MIRGRYIFKAWNASEQLFNLTADPREQTELQNVPGYRAELLKWRQRMVDQFEAEGRGPVWVLNGTLSKRIRSNPHSPNYPGAGPSPPSPGQVTCSPSSPALQPGITLGLMATEGVVGGGASEGPPYNRYCQDFVYGAHGGLSLRMVVKQDLCLVPGSSYGHNGYSSLSLANCTAAPASQAAFVIKANNTSPAHSRPQEIVHKASGLCVTALSSHTGTPGVVVLAQCHGAGVAQTWIFGTSGRLCQHMGASKAHVCLTLLEPKLARTSFV